MLNLKAALMGSLPSFTFAARSVYSASAHAVQRGRGFTLAHARTQLATAAYSHRTPVWRTLTRNQTAAWAGAAPIQRRIRKFMRWRSLYRLAHPTHPNSDTKNTTQQLTATHSPACWRSISLRSDGTLPRRRLQATDSTPSDGKVIMPISCRNFWEAVGKTHIASRLG